MEISATKKGHVLTVNLKGELDHHSAKQTRERIDAALRDTNIRELVLNMKGVSFMDSSGIGVILGRYRTVSARGGTMRIVGAGKSVARILRMAGVSSLLEQNAI